MNPNPPTSTENRIRSAAVLDAEPIARIHIDSWRAAYKGIVSDTFLIDLNLKSKTERWTAILSESQSKTYVMETGGKVTAWISYGPSRDEDCVGFDEIWALYVAPEAWRLGQGRKLIGFVEELARESGTTGLMLWVLERNLHARTFYGKAGFSPDGSTKKIEIGNEMLEESRFRKRV